ncbi:PREDICTED: disintegrin and metalloproteinase domain-containing protein 5-like [Odobenus rosmarus divergens]|uniref:Disintegrin and metalloproteinase domain-containing protein 5-like n=1 Tax=Odobenus rosmarus divergens TaxID=9708 RepID=A0A9B0LHZ2_ODORO
MWVELETIRQSKIICLELSLVGLPAQGAGYRDKPPPGAAGAAERAESPRLSSGAARRFPLRVRTCGAQRSCASCASTFPNTSTAVQRQPRSKTAEPCSFFWSFSPGLNCCTQAPVSPDTCYRLPSRLAGGGGDCVRLGDCILSTRPQAQTLSQPRALPYPLSYCRSLQRRWPKKQRQPPGRKSFHVSGLFDYMGSDIKAVTQKVIQIIGFVNTYPEGLSLESYTVSVVQLLGFNLGLSYDDPDTCYCSGDVCTMSPKAVQSGGVKEFSTCSLDDFKYLASHSGFECLQNILPEMPVYKQRERRVCGNGKLEKGEQCDCGPAENCTHKDCCDPRICVMKKGKQCGSGECCTLDCKLKPIGIQCRKPLDECDFPEYCDGVSSHCVPDTYARDGQSCDSGDAFCYGGRCRTHSKQCKDLIGGASRGGPFACYDEVNTRGDRYGNCGRDFCSYPNLLCGKLVCAWPHKALVSRANLSVIYTHVREEMCVSTFRNTEKKPKNTWTTYEKPEDRDDTFVQDGTVCGPAMYCLRFKCVEVQYQITNEECNSTYCNSHGVCNNLNHCHCEKGFDPPTCVQKKGEFGSIDDGHKAPSGKSYLREQNTTPSKHRFLLIFYISLPVLIITAIVLIKQNKIRELCYREETESERSVSEESSSNSKLSPTVSLNFHPIHCNLNPEEALNQVKAA